MHGIGATSKEEKNKMDTEDFGVLFSQFGISGSWLGNKFWFAYDALNSINQ
jgi:hypothetical protein